MKSPLLPPMNVEYRMLCPDGHQLDHELNGRAIGARVTLFPETLSVALVQPGKPGTGEKVCPPSALT